MKAIKIVNKYYVDRKNTNCLKWDKVEDFFGDKHLLPLWVADMDFKGPEGLVDAVHKRVSHGAFGCTPFQDFIERIPEGDESGSAA